MELRLYSFVNFYLSSIQQGIQTGHAAVDLVRRYRHVLGKSGQPELCSMVEEWADKHKTFIILNGGDNDAVREARSIVFASGFPCISFSEPGLRSLETCVVTILPESIFNTTI